MNNVTLWHISINGHQGSIIEYEKGWFEGILQSMSGQTSFVYGKYSEQKQIEISLESMEPRQSVRTINHGTLHYTKGIYQGQLLTTYEATTYIPDPTINIIGDTEIKISKVESSKKTDSYEQLQEIDHIESEIKNYLDTIGASNHYHNESPKDSRKRNV